MIENPEPPNQTSYLITALEVADEILDSIIPLIVEQFGPLEPENRKDLGSIKNALARARREMPQIDKTNKV